jgi:hypothetical protein
MSASSRAKDFLGELPFTAELYWLIRNPEKKVFSRFSLEALKARLPKLVEEVEPYANTAKQGKKIFLFASMHIWISHTVVTGLALRGLGHEVTVGYLPYGDFAKPIRKFDLRRHDLYAHDVLRRADSLLKRISFLDLEPANEIPEKLTLAIKQITTFDAQYILQREEISGTEPIYLLRQERNLSAARRAFKYMKKNRPDVVIVPNGMIQEYGAVYETARFLGIPVVSYEFGEQDQRIWLGQDRWVIHHIIDELWATRENRILDPGQRGWLESFLAGRQKSTTGTQFAHLWQIADRSGGTKVRAILGLDERPVVLLPTNVLGDSATLGMTIFSMSMTEWLQRVILFLAAKPQIQVVVRIHPAETWTVGPSVLEIIHQVLPELPSHIRLIGPNEKVNTYDLMDIADLALVYTTTVGLEMATRGIPVLVSGRAHYRKKGFTIDADSWVEYFAKLDLAIKDLRNCLLTPAQLEQAWNYAYCFFKEYPLPFPWHVEKTSKDLERESMAYVLSPKGQIEFGKAFQQLAGEVLV